MEIRTRFITENEVALITGLSVHTLRNWRFMGKGMPYCRVGRAIRYDYSDVIEFMRGQRIEPVSMVLKSANVI